MSTLCAGPGGDAAGKAPPTAPAAWSLVYGRSDSTVGSLLCRVICAMTGSARQTPCELQKRNEKTNFSSTNGFSKFVLISHGWNTFSGDLVF
jgi:hypothetical protein